VLLGSSPLLWISLAVTLAATVAALRLAARWGWWEMAIPVAAVAAVSTGPVLQILEEGGILRPDIAQQIAEYRWLTMATLCVAAMVVVYRIVERERSLYRELAAAEERFRSISRVLPVGVFQADVDGRCSYTNDVAVSMIDIQLSDAIGEGWIRRLHAEDRDRVMEEWQAAAIEGRDYRSEYRFRRPSGEVIWVLGHVLALKDADGDVIGHVGAITDITERKKNELALQQARRQLEQRVAERTAELTRINRDLEREIENRRRAEAATADSEARLRAILDNTPAHIFIKDLAGRYLYINTPNAMAAFPVGFADFIGRTDAEIFPPKVAADMALADREALQTGSRVESEDELETADGIRTYLTVKFPLKSADGEVYAIAGVATDITRRAALTEAVRRIVALSPAGMCTFDRKGRFLVVNDSLARSLGYERDELIGHEYEEFLHPEDVASTRDARVAVVDEGRNVSAFENRYKTKSGEYRVLSWHATFAKDNETVYAACTDVTEARRIALEVSRRSDEMAHLSRLQTMGEMASEIAHELNQPLSAIVNYARGAANRLRNHAATETELASLLEKVAAQALRGGDLIRKIRDFAKRGEANLDERDLNKLVRDAVELVTAGHFSRVPIRLSLSRGLPHVRADDVQIQQVIVNLARNALEALEDKPEGTLEISTEVIGDNEIRLAVRDNGPGLDEVEAERIFDAFYTTKPQGLGLGLPISRSIVAAHGGRLWAESSPGGGTSFYVTLPVADRAAA
jgi:two-component system sensor kinase FixL